MPALTSQEVSDKIAVPRKWNYLLHNFHKLAENTKTRIAIYVVIHNRLPKEFGIEKRERNSKELTNWRNRIFTRDNFTCQECGERGSELNAHHIVKWAEAPRLRYNLDNGLTLCKKCHKKQHSKTIKNNAIC